MKAYESITKQKAQNRKQKEFYRGGAESAVRQSRNQIEKQGFTTENAEFAEERRREEIFAKKNIPNSAYSAPPR